LSEEVVKKTWMADRKYLRVESFAAGISRAVAKDDAENDVIQRKRSITYFDRSKLVTRQSEN
jgi:hypothetical protein